MKKLVYLLPLLIMLASAGCLSDKSNNPSPSQDVYTGGTFAGEFRRITLNPDKSIDTLKANIKLVIEPGAGYAVLGDTSTLHAGSKGHYSILGNSIIFIDDIYPKTGTPAKTHLNGEYIFVYNGSIFQMKKTDDGLSVQYDLKRTN